MPNLQAKSLKRRVFFLFGGFTLIVSAFYLGLVLLVAYIVEDEIMHRMVKEERKHILSVFSQTGKIVEPRNNFMKVYWFTKDGKSDLPSELARALSRSPNAEEIFTESDKTHFHVQRIILSKGKYGGMVTNAHHLDEDKHGILVANVNPFIVVTSMSKGMIFLSLGLVMLFLLASLVAAYRLTRHIVLPIEQLSDQVKDRFTQENLTNQDDFNFSASSINNEIGYLSQTLESAFNQLADALNREYHFTRDIGHELRTPLTIIKNQIAIEGARSSLESKTSPDNQQGLRLIEKEIDKIRRVIDSLLALARQERVEMEPFNLRALLEESTLNLHQVYPGFQVDLEVADEVVLRGNPQLSQLLFINLMENAIRHGKDLQLSIEYQNNLLIFRNKIKTAFSETNNQGIGQGLFLVERIGDKLNWQINQSVVDNQFTVEVTTQ